MTEMTPTDKLRQLLGEQIPVDGTPVDTLFSEAEIQQFLDSTPDIDRAAFEGWRAKAAKLSSLVDTTEGNAQRKFSQLLSNAMSMVRMYQKSTGPSGGLTDGRTRVGRIKRDPVQW